MNVWIPILPKYIFLFEHIYETLCLIRSKSLIDSILDALRSTPFKFRRLCFVLKCSFNFDRFRRLFKIQFFAALRHQLLNLMLMFWCVYMRDWPCWRVYFGFCVIKAANILISKIRNIHLTFYIAVLICFYAWLTVLMFLLGILCYLSSQHFTLLFWCVYMCDWPCWCVYLGFCVI